jgi:protein gp37
MGKETDIQWCDSTVNPTDFMCCGCELWNKQRRDCYAGRFAERRAGKGAFDRPVVLKPGRTAKAALWSDLRGSNRPDKPWLNGQPRVIFIGDMADVFQPEVSFEYLWNEVICPVVSNHGRRHIWMLLTKQTRRLAHFERWMLAQHNMPWPENLWPGVSVTSEQTTWRIDELVQIKSAHRFISYEPAWEYVDFCRWTTGVEITDCGKGPCPSYKIELIIMGGQSGPGAKPFDLLWARDAKELCQADEVHFFLKQLGSNPMTNNVLEWPDGTELKGQDPKLRDPKGGDWSEWPEALKVREFPEV